MNHDRNINPGAEGDNRSFRQVSAKASALLGNAAAKLLALIDEDSFVAFPARQGPLNSRLTLPGSRNLSGPSNFELGSCTH